MYVLNGRQLQEHTGTSTYCSVSHLLLFHIISLQLYAHLWFSLPLVVLVYDNGEGNAHGVCSIASPMQSIMFLWLPYYDYEKGT